MRPRNAGSTIAAGLLLGLATATPVAADSVADRVFAGLQQGRIGSGAEELARPDFLDEVARERATIVAALPHSERLLYDEPIAPVLRELGVRVVRSSIHLDMVKGYTDPASAFLRTWKGYEQSWATAMDPVWESIGLAAARGEDGWIVLVGVQIVELPVPDDLHELERATLRAINEIREERGLGALRPHGALTELARGHSEDMARKQYFSHRSRDGHQVGGRAKLAGIDFRAIGENIQKNRGHADPVAVAVASWMDSKGHREAILSPRFERTGVGVAIDDEGAVYFTQVFLTPGSDGG